MQTVHADLVVGLPVTESGNTIISVCVDAFTGWLSLSAHAHKDAETISKTIAEDVFWKFGLPEVLRTDNGSEFRNGTSRAIAHLLQIRHSTTTPYTPQANGKVETRNKTIYDLLVSMCKDDPANHRKWDEFLPVVAWAYNTTVNQATGFTPFRALFGREARSPSDSWIEEFATHFNTNIFDYVTRITESLRQVWDIIATRTIEERDRVAATYEEKVCRAFAPFRIGEQFYYKAMTRRSFKSLDDEKTYKMSSKLQYRYTGPHTVTEVYNPVTYKANIDGFSRIVHANRMKRDNRRDVSRKKIQQNRRLILKRNPVKARHTMVPKRPTSLNPTEDANLLATSIRMVTDDFQHLSISQITAAYGVYDEEIDLPETETLDTVPPLIWLSDTWDAPRKGLPRTTNPLLATSTTMRVIGDANPQVFQRDPQDTWALTAAVATEPHPCVDLLGKGCLWRVTKPDDGPFNGSFHAPNECCRYCIIR
jgi:hypothetical protein